MPFPSGSSAVAPLLQCPLYIRECGIQKATRMGTYQFLDCTGGIQKATQMGIYQSLDCTGTGCEELCQS